MPPPTATTLRLVCADETGLLKTVQLRNTKHSLDTQESKNALEQRISAQCVRRGNAIITKMGSQSIELGVEQMAWEPSQDAFEKRVVTGLRNHVVQSWDLVSGKRGRSLQLDFGESKIIGLDVISSDRNQLFACSASGKFVINPWQVGNSEDVENFDWETTELKVPDKLCVMRVNTATKQHFLIGGQDRDLQIWDLESQACVFKAKNFKHDFLGLSQPIYIKDAQFLRASDGFRVAVGTGHYQLKIYDTRSQRRPTMNLVLGEHPINSICETIDGNSIICGDSVGTISRVDLRQGRLIAGYKGAAGSIRKVVHHPTLPMIAVTGLDRFLRVYDVESKKQIYRVYLKQRQTCLLFSSDEIRESEDEEIDEIWNELDKSAENASKAKENGRKDKATAKTEHRKSKKDNKDDFGEDNESEDDFFQNEDEKSEDEVSQDSQDSDDNSDDNSKEKDYGEEEDSDNDSEEEDYDEEEEEDSNSDNEEEDSEDDSDDRNETNEKSCSDDSEDMIPVRSNGVGKHSKRRSNSTSVNTRKRMRS